MKTSTRRRLGLATMIISVLVALVLQISGVPLLTLTDVHSSSFPGGGGVTACTVWCIKMHWPLHAVCAAGLVGLTCAAWPKRTPPVLPP
jgi:hypothetical protein